MRINIVNNSNNPIDSISAAIICYDDHACLSFEYTTNYIAQLNDHPNIEHLFVYIFLMLYTNKIFISVSEVISHKAPSSLFSCIIIVVID